ncbi:MAG: cardiolipin synthase [Bdellovibrionaceae bacterium]|nr:cardiolipin synthase [Pseudobdellovibrionaceae bacterium]MBX3034878.1 cardiolipin synthase [Pseudobdellovibrionaceae bacterium]
MVGDLSVWHVLGVFGYVVGVLTALQALYEVRTPQGTAAWVVFLVSFPWIAVPAYWIFGRKRFVGYRTPRLSVAQATGSIAERVRDFFRRQGIQVDPLKTPFSKSIEKLINLPFTNHNRVDLLIDGRACFDGLFADMRAAREYLLVQYYIFCADGIGTAFKDILVKKSREGLRCYFLYDEIGTKLPRDFLREMTDAGVRVEAFNSTRGAHNRFQLNFRNHRKTVVVDGRLAFTGGLNVADEYMGLDPQLTPWRDTHVKLQGPVVQGVQLSFQEDWYWACGERLDLRWEAEPCRDENMVALAIPSGPADPLETATLFHLLAVQSAKKRLWIASPYFAPDEQFVSALQLAALRGVEIRILIPRRNDGFWNTMVSESYFAELEAVGIRFFWYENGFMHQKVLLVDDSHCFVGTANFDCRSFRLNFEMTVAVVDADFSRQVEAMLQEDFRHGSPASSAELARKPWWYRTGVRVCRLFSPIL